MLKKLFVSLLAIAVLMGSQCDLAPVDRKLRIYETYDGEQVEELPEQIPWIVVADDSVEDPEALDEVIDQMNEWFDPYIVLTGGVDQEQFNSLWSLEPEDRAGYILFWVGALPDPDWEFDEYDSGPGGVAVLYLNVNGVIYAVDIAIDSGDAYDRDTFQRRSIHELGHALGFEHDDYSMDMGSCMSSPPPYGCRILEDDVTYWIDAWRLSNG